MATTLNQTLNTVYDNASPQYRANVPDIRKGASPDMVLKALAPVSTGGVLTFKPEYNEFIDVLVNRIGMTIITGRRFKNPLSKLKSGRLPFGSTIQEIYTNPSIAENYTYTSQDLLAIKKPDVKAIHYSVNRREKYPVTITYEDISLAFTGDFEMNQFISSIINSLYNGDEIDELDYTKSLVSIARRAGHIKEKVITGFNVDKPTEAQLKELLSAIQIDSKRMQFPRTDYNSFAKVNPTHSDKPVKTWTPLANQILVIRADIVATLGLEVFAYMFNLEKGNLNTTIIEVDDFGAEDQNKTICALCDDSWFRIKDKLNTMGHFFNSDTLTHKYTLHRWELIEYSTLANAVCYTTEATVVEGSDLSVMGATGVSGDPTGVTEGQE